LRRASKSAGADVGQFTFARVPRRVEARFMTYLLDLERRVLLGRRFIQFDGSIFSEPNPIVLKYAAPS